MTTKRRRPDNWPTTAPNHPDMMDQEHFAEWAEWAYTERVRALRRARQLRTYQRLLESEYLRRYGEPLRTWEATS